ncbi:MAG TPA: acetate/propionate family kinase [Terriglobales bacterium]|nr:acetate/propionate family kinase [Terriglobales bacterium]
MADQDNILVLNSGSSSLKFGLYTRGEREEEVVLNGSAKGIGRENGAIEVRSAAGEQLALQAHDLESQHDALTKLAEIVKKHMRVEPVAVGHRIVHGGPYLRDHQPITTAVMEKLERARHFAPLHIPPALTLIRQAQQTFPNALHIACFDTAFHRTLPDVAARFPLPARYSEQGVIRYGFHGLSYESLVHRLGPDLPRRAVLAHLGNGCSLAAVFDGKSIDTSMGLTPTGGVPMSTRAGDLDPGVLLYLWRSEHLGIDALEELLNRRSGLAGFSGGEGDMQALLSRAATKDNAAELAVSAFCAAVRKCVGAYAALMGGIDLLVFTGGIGEHSDEIRRRICQGLGFLGLDNNRVRVMRSDEEGQIARHCRALIGTTPSAALP